MQQGDPLGPVLFALVLRKLVSGIEAHGGCFELRLNLWYLDDGLLAGERSAAVCALNLAEELGPHLRLHITPSVRCLARVATSIFKIE